MEWKRMDKNYVLNGDGLYISYLPPLYLDAVNLFDKLLVTLGAKKQEDLGRDETAICFNDGSLPTGWSHYILFGDHREQYEALIHKGFDACVEYFTNHIDEMADSSDKPETQ